MWCFPFFTSYNSILFIWFQSPGQWLAAFRRILNLQWSHCALQLRVANHCPGYCTSALKMKDSTIVGFLRERERKGTGLLLFYFASTHWQYFVHEFNHLPPCLEIRLPPFSQDFLRKDSLVLSQMGRVANQNQSGGAVKKAEVLLEFSPVKTWKGAFALRFCTKWNRKQIVNKYKDEKKSK